MERRPDRSAHLSLVLVLAMMAGCGRLSFARLPADGGDGGTFSDASSDASTDTSAPLDGARMDGSITSDAAPRDGGLPDGLVVEIAAATALSESGAVDRSPFLRGDLLEIYFSSDRAGGAGADDIWRATRTAASERWGPPAPVSELNTSAAETHPALSGDGLMMVFSRSDARGANVFFTTRPDLGSPWSAPTEQSEINSGAVDDCPTLSRNALEIVFCSRRRGGTQDLHTALRSAAGDAFGTVNYLGPVSSTSTERGPFLGSGGGLRLLFASDRPGGAGGFDLYEAARATTDGAWGAPIALSLINGPANDEDPWASEDGRLVYFSSDRSGDYEIYVVALR